MDRFSKQFDGQDEQPRFPINPLGADSPDINFSLPDTFSIGQKVEDSTHGTRMLMRFTLSKKHIADHPDDPIFLQYVRFSQIQRTFPALGESDYDAEKAEFFVALGDLLRTAHYRQAIARSDLTPYEKQLMYDDITEGEQISLDLYEKILNRRPDLKTVLKSISH